MSYVSTLRICLVGLIATPLLIACNLPRDQHSVRKPAVIEFASRVGSMEIDLKGKCDAMDVHAVDLINNPDTPQIQLDCYGFNYFGMPRLAEFIFVNDALAVVAINVEPSEIPSLEAAYIETFGTPTHVKDTVIAFADDYAGVRNDPPQAVYFAEFATPFLIDAMSLRPDRE